MSPSRRLRRSCATALLVVTVAACTIEQDLSPRVEDANGGEAAAAEREPDPSPSTDSADALADASPSPTPEPDGEPSPSPDAEPSPRSEPSPDPVPSPEPKPDPVPSPDPKPSPVPDPTTSPSPSPSPAPGNRAPAAGDDSATVQEDDDVTVAVLGNDRDPDGDALRLVGVTAPTNGTATIASGRIRYVPSANYNGTDRFVYTVEDPAGLQDTAQVTVTVAAVNDAPVAGSDSGYLVQQGRDLVLGNLLDNDSDIDGDSLVIELVSGGTSGTVELVDDQTVIYRHGGASVTSDTFRYRANDGSTFSDTVTVTLAVNRRPVARDDTLEVWSEFGEETFTFNVLTGVVGNGCCSSGESWTGGADSDPDGDALTYTGPASISRPSWMTGFQCVQSGACQVRIARCTSVSTPYRITYSIQDARGGTDTATLSIYPKYNCLR